MSYSKVEEEYRKRKKRQEDPTKTARPAQSSETENGQSADYSRVAEEYAKRKQAQQQKQTSANAAEEQYVALMTGASGAAQGAQHAMNPLSAYDFRKMGQESAKKELNSSWWDMLGQASMATQAAQNGQMLTQEQVQAQMNAGARLNAAQQRNNEANQIIDWEGRQDLLDEYRILAKARSGPVAEEAQRVREQLRQGDETAGNIARGGDMSYTVGESLTHGGKAVLERGAAAFYKAFLTSGDLYAKSQAMQGPTEDELIQEWLTGQEPGSIQKQRQAGYESQEYQQFMQDRYAEAKALRDDAAKELQMAKENQHPVWQAGVDLGSTMIEMGADAIFAKLTGGSSLIPMAIRVFGQSAGEAEDLGYSLEQQAVYGAANAAIEVFTEQIGGIGGRAQGKGWTDELANRLIDELSQSVAGRRALRLLVAANEEGLEEVLSDLLHPAAQYVAGMDVDSIDPVETLYNYLLGAAAGFFSAGPRTMVYTGYQATTSFGGDAQGLIDMAQAAGEGTRARELAGQLQQRLTDKGSISQLQAEDLSQQAQRDIQNEDRPRIEAAVREQLQQRSEKPMSQRELDRAVRNIVDEAFEGDGSTYLKTDLEREVYKDLQAQFRGGGTERWLNTADLAASRVNDAEMARLRNVETKDGQQVRITGADMVDGELQLRYEQDGKTVTAKQSELNLNDGQKDTLRQLVEILGEDAAAAYNGMGDGIRYGKPSDLLDYATSWAVVRDLFGAKGASLEKALGSNLRNRLSDTQVMQAMKVGQMKAQKSGSAQQQTGKVTQGSGQVSLDGGTITLEGGKNVQLKAVKDKAKVQRSRQYAAVKAVARALGIDVVLFESEANSKGELTEANGAYQNGVIYLDWNAGMNNIKETSKRMLLRTMSHELTHDLQRSSPAEYEKLKQRTIEYLAEKMGEDYVDLVKGKMSNQKGLSYEGALDEVVADACETMLADSEYVQQMIREDRSFGQKIWDWIKKFFTKIEAQDEGAKILRENIDEFRTLWDNAMRATVEARRGQSQERDAEGVVPYTETAARAETRSGAEESAMSAQLSVREEKADVLERNAEELTELDPTSETATVTLSDGVQYSIRSMRHDIAEGKMFEDLERFTDMSHEETQELRKNLERLTDIIALNRDILDLNETFGKDNRPFKPYKPNSDPLYTISLDFSTLCRKRLMTQYVIERLQTELTDSETGKRGRPLTAEEQLAVRDLMKEYAKQEKALKVACAMCYVEAARLKAPGQIQRFMRDPTEPMRRYFALRNSEFNASVREAQADFKEQHGYARDAKKADMKPSDVKALNKLSDKLRSEYQLSAEEQAQLDIAKTLPNETYLTAANLAKLAEEHPIIYDAYTAKIRAATRSKSLEADIPYYYGDSSRVVSDDFIAAVNQENGMRFSSWSDFQIQHMLDMMTAVIELSTRHCAMHGYTKFLEQVRIFGRTGMMFNMSGVANGTGLKEDGSLDFSPTESVLVFGQDGEYDAIRARDEFPETAGLQCIGISTEHIQALLDSDIIDYIIPYHTSGLNATLRRMAQISNWKDFTAFQNAKVDSSIKFDPSIHNRETWHKEPVFSEFFNAAKQESNGYRVGEKGVVTMRRAADLYKQMCRERGMTPKFSWGNSKVDADFSNDPNYWKLLIDRKMINQKTGALIEQKPVRPDFDFKLIEQMVQEAVDAYDPTLQDRALNYVREHLDELPQRIADLKKAGAVKKATIRKTSNATKTLQAGPVAAVSEANAEAQLSARETEEGSKKAATTGGGTAQLSPREKQIINDAVDKAIQTKGTLGTPGNRVTVTDVPADLAEYVLAASDGTIDISKKKIALHGSELWHEYKRHALQKKREESRDQIPFTKRRYINAINAIFSPDYVECVTFDANNRKQQQSFLYAKRTDIGDYIVVVAVSGTGNGKSDVYPTEIIHVNKSKWNYWMRNGGSIVEMLYSSDLNMQNSLDIQRTKKNRVSVAQFARKRAIANTPHVSQFSNSIAEESEKSNTPGQLSARGNLGYHAGDLGKAEHLNIQGRYRGTGHFGTGTYFVGEEEKVTNDSHYGKRPQHAVDFSDYNLYKVRSDRTGYQLHDALRIIDGGIKREWIRPAMDNQFNIINPTGYYDLAKSKYGEDWVHGDNLLNAMLEYAADNGISVKTLDEYKADEGFAPDDADAAYYYEDYVKDTVKEEIGKVNAEYREFANMVFDLHILPGFTNGKIFSALNAVADYQDATPRTARADSYATVFMKAIGYDGVDTRGTRLDNTEYGSVIYDVKPETVAYSVRSNAKTDRELLNDLYERVQKREREIAERNEKGLKAGYQKMLSDKQDVIDEQREALERYHKLIGRYRNAEDAVNRELNTLDELINRNGSRAQIAQQRTILSAAEQRLSTAARALSQGQNSNEIQSILRRERQLQRERTSQQIRESVNSREMRRRVKQRTAELYEMLTTNSDKVHVPEVLKQPLAEFLESINIPVQETYRDRRTGEVRETRSHKRFGARLQQIRDILENQQRYLSGDETAMQDLGGYLDISEDSMEFLRGCTELITYAMSENRDFTINEMNAEQLRDLANFLSNLRTAIRRMNTFLANERFASVREAASADITELHRLGRAKNIAENRILNEYLWKNGTPYYIFKRFGAGGESIFQGFAKGWSQMAFDARDIMAFTKKAYTDKEVKQWRKEKHDFTLEDGTKITMTTAQIMELSQLLGRQQAVQHLQHGGMRIGNIETKTGAKGDTRHHHLSQADLEQILGALSERQAEVAREMQHFMAERGADWGNEVSMKRFGYRFYTEGEGYYPIKTDSNDRPMADTDAQRNSMFRLLNLSSSKSLNPKATNALVVGDIFDTFTDHMADMAKLHGMGLPILDAIKWFNFKERIDRDDGGYDTRTLQGALEEAFGSAAGSYFRTLMKDINGQTENGDRGTGLASLAIGAYKAQAVAANLRVALLQPTAYLRAATVLKPRYMVAAFGNFRASVFAVRAAQAAWKEAMEHSGEMVWKDIGGYDTDLSRSMRSQIQHSEGVREKIVNGSMVLAEWGDKLTWGRLWAACKLQARAENPGVSGQALMDATEKLFREVIYSSQVMDSTLTRSELMRGKTNTSKLLTAFLAEPTLSVNILMDTASQYDLDKRRSGRAEAWKKNKGKIFKAFSLWVCTQTAAALVESLADAMRDDDDEEYWKKLLQALFGEDNAKRMLGEELDKNAKGWLASAYSGNLMQDYLLFNKLPVLKEVTSLLSGFKSRNMLTEGVENLLNVYKIWRETKQLEDGILDRPTSVTYYGKMTPWGKVYKTLQAISQLSGTPLYNASRDGIAIWNTIMNGWKDDWKVLTYDNRKSTDKLTAAVRGGEDTGEIRKKLAENGVTEKEMNSAVRTEIRAMYNGTQKTPGISEEEAVRLLVFEGGMRQKDAESQVQEWKYEKLNEAKYDDMREGYIKGEISREQAIEDRMTYGGQSRKNAEQTVREWDCEKDTGIKYSEMQNAYLDGQITRQQAIDMRVKYGGAKDDDAEALVTKWTCEKETGIPYDEIRERFVAGSLPEKKAIQMMVKYGGKDEIAAQKTMYRYRFVGSDKNLDEITDSAATHYYAEFYETGMSKQVYYNAWMDLKEFGADYDAKGDSIPYSKMNKIMDYIDKLPVTTAQKDLFFLMYYKDKQLPKTPWH